jgi:hypothetical protein
MDPLGAEAGIVTAPLVGAFLHVVHAIYREFFVHVTRYGGVVFNVQCAGS